MSWIFFYKIIETLINKMLKISICLIIYCLQFVSMENLNRVCKLCKQMHK